MRFEHEFTVEVPLEQAWRALPDADAVAASLPRAELRAVDGVHTGRIQLEGSRDLACEATITTVDQDEDEHVATVSVHGRQVGGPGIGSALLRSRFSAEGSVTRVSLTADVLTTGHDPGNGFRAGAERIFEAVVEGLERRARERPAAPPERPAAPAAAAPPPAAEAPTAAQLPVLAERSWVERMTAPKPLLGGAAGLVIAAVVLRRTRRGRRRLF
jgi:carbon monoxide dehydrogenase subunit G